MDTPFAPGRLAPPQMLGCAASGSGPLRSGRLTLGRRAAAAGDLDVAELAFALAANEYRQSQLPILEVFALAELTVLYQQQNRFDRLPTLIRRARGVMQRPSLSPGQAAIVRLAVELIESGPENPAGLAIFSACWTATDAHEAESDL